MSGFCLEEALRHINPASCGYGEWLAVGMALKHEGFPPEAWEEWSRADPARFHPGECAQKWESFNGAPNPVTGGTIAELARRGGYRPQPDGGGLEWDGEVGAREGAALADPGWVEPLDIDEPAKWDPAAQLSEYIRALFEPGERVGYVVDSAERDGRRVPASKGAFDRTAGELLRALAKCGRDIGAAMGDADPAAGAWIRFNPLDGKGVRNENVSSFRHALVESDSMPIERQHALIRELELPVACLVHSGGKSLHAIVRIGAPDYAEYRRRVDFLYAACRKGGLAVDGQNKNPSRLSRMPGFERGGRKQHIVAANIGQPSFEAWREWMEAADDGLPEIECAAGFIGALPALSPPIIEGVLRQGHKLLLAGPPKSGKTFALIELAIAIAEGRRWMGFQCGQGRVLYANLEVDGASAKHRIAGVYAALGWEPRNAAGIDLWSLRGSSLPIDRLAPKLIRRARKRQYAAVIFDPIYKIITGDENSADQMAAFCNQFDRICAQLGAAAIYCHHHSKGAQAHKRSMDRASGSGVFARDPDALLDYIELEPPEGALEAFQPGAMSLPQGRRPSALRIEGTLREFAAFDPVDCWFRHPIHVLDAARLLKGAEAGEEAEPWRRAARARRGSAGDARAEKRERLEQALAGCNFGARATVEMLADYLDRQPRTVYDTLRKMGYFVKSGKIYKEGEAPDGE